MQTARVIIPLGSLKSINSTLVLDEADLASQFHHLVRVLRIQPGWKLEILDESTSRKLFGTIQSCSSTQINLQITGESENNPTHPVTLLLGLPEFDVLGRIITKLTEIQVSAVKIFIPDNTQHKNANKRLADKISRLEKLRDAARIQSGSGPLQIKYFPNLEETISKLAKPDSSQPIRFLASLDGYSHNLQEILHKNYPLEVSPGKTDIILVVGPEGDLSAREYKLCSDADFIPVSLGSSVLRVETAAVSAAFCIQNYFNR